MLWDDDQELTAESVACPDLRVPAIIPPPLIAVAGRVGVGRVDVIDSTRRGVLRPARRQDPRAAPHAIVHVQLADLREVERLEKEPALRIRMPCRSLLPM